MDLREWLFLGGALLVALILFDGWRRLSGRRRRLKLDIDASLSGIGADADGHNPELPNGGARIKSQVDLAAAQAESAVLPNSPELDAAVAEMNADLEREASMLSGLSASRDGGELSAPTDTGDFISKPRVADVAPAQAKRLSEGVTVIGAAHMSEPTETELSEISSTEVTDYETVEAALETEMDNQASVDAPETEAVLELNEEPEPQIDAQLEAEPATDDQPQVEEEPQPVKEPQLVEEHQPAEEPQRAEETTTVELSEPEAETQATPSEEVPELAESPAAAAQAKKPTRPQPEIGEMDDLFAIPDLDFDRPIHEILDMEAKDEASDVPESELESELASKAVPTPKRKTRKSKAKEQPQTDTLFDALLEQVDDAELPELEDIESLIPESVDAQPSEVVAEAATTGKRQLRQLDFSDPDLALAIFVVAPKGERFSGRSLRALAEACGLEFGQQNLFHRFEDASDRSPIQFSMSDAVNTGQFDLSTMDDYQTPAVSLFMSLAEARDPAYAYECMLATAETFAKNMRAELLDSERSVLRSQTKEHLRERVSAYQLKQRSKRRGR